MKHPFFHVTIDLSAPETHRAKVTIRKGSENLPGRLDFPVWTPGSYMVREYSRHVTCFTRGQKVAKNRWQLDTGATSVSYEVYCFERSVRTSYLDGNYASLVGASLLPLLHGPFSVELKVPSRWSFVSSALNFRSAGKGRWLASVRDDDQWIDSPIVAAAPGFGGLGKFTFHGIPHEIAWVGQGYARSMKETEAAFRKIAQSTIQIFGGAPFKKYWFLLHFGHKLYGGLEHRDSQLSQFDGAAVIEDKSWEGFLRLIAHEYLHSWNVKSIRPRALGPFDYFAENYTQDIWFAEGITDYIDDMIAWKAGLISEDSYKKARIKDATHLPDGNPGHSRRSLAESSFDAWIRYYRPDEDSLNTDISYYSKGALLGWCWDALLQKKSRGKWTLPKLMRAIWKEFGIDAYEPLATAKPGFTRAELLAFAEKATGISQQAQVESWVTRRRPIPWRDAARFFRLNVKEKVADPSLHLLGMQLQWKNGAGAVQKVLSGTAAEQAGIAPSDELIAVNGRRVTDSEGFQIALKKATADGKEIDILLARLDRIFGAKVRWREHKGLGIEYVSA